MSPDRPYGCTCGGAAGDLGELEEHVLTASPGEHRPTGATTPRITEHLARVDRRHQVLAAVAAAAGVTVPELVDALTGR